MDVNADVMLPKVPTYILVVDTDSYAGNFERQLAGFATGICDIERGHGQEEAEQAERDAPQMTAALKAKSLPVRHKQYGKVTNTIRATPGRLNNGMGFNYPDGDPDAAADARERAKQSAIAYHAEQDAKIRRRLETGDFEPDGPGAWTKEACERTLATNRDFVERAGEHAFPAYESVAMFFSQPLTDEEMAFVRRRAEAYAADPTPQILVRKPFRILDVYMVKAETVVVETRLDDVASV